MVFILAEKDFKGDNLTRKNLKYRHVFYSMSDYEKKKSHK